MDINEHIKELILSWYEDTKLISDVSAIMCNIYMREIVNYNEKAIPIILKEIENKPSTLVWAMNDITKMSISQQTITITEACKLWVNWGKSMGFI